MIVGVGMAIAGAIGVVVFVLRSDFGNSAMAFTFGVGAGGICAFGGWSLGLVPCVTAEDDGLRIRNPRQEVFIGWDQILEVEPGYAGLRIRTQRNEVVTAWALQKSNAAAWSGRTTRADEAARFIRQRMAVDRRDDA